MSILDCRAMACPGPVLKCKEEIEKNTPKSLEILVDNSAAKENVCRFLRSQGYGINDIYEDKGIFKIIAQTDKSQTSLSDNKETDMSIHSCEIPCVKQEDKQLIFITSDIIGHGDNELGKKLMLNFLKTLPEMGSSLWRIILLNGGVRLATKEGEYLDALKKLEQMGVSILVCGTCLDFFNLLEQKKIGETTNMLDVVTSLQLATKVIKI